MTEANDKAKKTTLTHHYVCQEVMETDAKEPRKTEKTEREEDTATAPKKSDLILAAAENLKEMMENSVMK